MLGMFEEVILVFFSSFFQDLCEFVIHCNNLRHHFSLFVCSFCSFGGNEAIIVELRFICFEWHFYHLFWGFLSQLRKMMPALAFIFMIAAPNA